MSRKIRLGNDIDITWSLLDKDEQPYIVEGRDFAVEIHIGKKRFKISNTEASGNSIHFIYYGKDQKVTGPATLVYIENGGRVDMVTFDTKDVFTMVEHSWLAVDSDEQPETVTLDVVTVLSNLESSIGPRGYSAYEIAVQNGYTGTEEEWIASLKPHITADANGNVYCDGELLTDAIYSVVSAVTVGEQGRQEAETTRQTQETARQTAEGRRATAEEGRAAAESGRASAEQSRVAAETTRENRSSTDHQRAENDHSRAEQDHQAIAKAVLFTPQTLTEGEKAQARENIGAESSGVGQLVEPITYEELKAKRDAGELTPGLSYRITDYVATTIQANTRSANHPFDIIVRAISENEFAEEAKAIIHEGDTYFSSNGANLSAWKVWYAIDNDATRFTWADSENGRGVVYRLIDEWDNDLPYDFKGVQFKRFYVTGVTAAYSDALSPLIGLPIGQSTARGLVSGSDFKWFYTFSNLGDTWSDEVTDGSLNGLLVQRNTIVSNQYDSGGLRKLNNCVFAGGKVLYDFMYAINPNVNLEEQFFFFDNVFDGESVINNTVFGYMVLSRSDSAFRHNTVVGMLRHCRMGSTFSANTIFVTQNCSHFTTGNSFENNVMRFNQFSYNTVGNYFKNNYFYLTAAVQVNSFGEYFGYNSIVGEQIGYCRFGNGIIYNSFSNIVLSTSQFEGQIDDCEFSGAIKSSSFGGLMSYVIFVGGTNGSLFFGVDTRGGIRGTSSSKIRIESNEFIVDAQTGVRRRINLVADVDGNLVATWFDDGKMTGMMKAVADATWTPLSLPYFKPATGIPASDLASGVIPDISGKEDTSNKSQSVETDKTSTTKYPSVKAVADALEPKYEKPQSGIPASDLATGVVPDVSNLTQSLTASAKKIWGGTAAEYALLTPDNDTIYFIKP